MEQSKPQRIQLSRVKGWRMPPNTVKVDRSTRWGNHFRIEAIEDGTFVVRRTSWAWAGDLATAQTLACWCKPGIPCHADVMLEIANG